MYVLLKFSFFEKATKICAIFPMRKITHIFVAFSEMLNFDLYGLLFESYWKLQCKFALTDRHMQIMQVRFCFKAILKFWNLEFSGRFYLLPVFMKRCSAFCWTRCKLPTCQIKFALSETLLFWKFMKPWQDPMMFTSRQPGGHF